MRRFFEEINDNSNTLLCYIKSYPSESKASIRSGLSKSFDSPVSLTSSLLHPLWFGMILKALSNVSRNDQPLPGSNSRRLDYLATVYNAP